MSKPNLNFRISLGQLSTRFLGYGGIRTEHLLKPQERYHRQDPKRLTAAKVAMALRDFEPHSVLMLIGDNDIRADTDPDILAAHIILTASTIKMRFNVTNMIICLLLPRFNEGCEEYNTIAWEVNRRLVVDAPAAGLSAHDHGFRFPQRASVNECQQDKLNYTPDGVHLKTDGPGGYSKLAKSLRHAAISVSKGAVRQPQRLLVLGHSHVKRLQQHLQRKDNGC